MRKCIPSDMTHHRDIPKDKIIMEPQAYILYVSTTVYYSLTYNPSYHLDIKNAFLPIIHEEKVCIQQTPRLLLYSYSSNVYCLQHFL